MDPECADNYAPPVQPIGGSKDGKGAADHDTTYHFGEAPTSHLSLRTYGRLWILRGHVLDGDPRYADDTAPSPPPPPSLTDDLARPPPAD